jgi:hypothetical protein
LLLCSLPVLRMHCSTTKRSSPRSPPPAYLPAAPTPKVGRTE